MEARVNTIFLNIDRFSSFKAPNPNVVHDLPNADVNDLLVNGHGFVSRNDAAQLHGRNLVNTLIDHARPTLDRIKPEARRGEASITSLLPWTFLWMVICTCWCLAFQLYSYVKTVGGPQWDKLQVQVPNPTISKYSC